jgi:hypothetical protein
MVNLVRLALATTVLALGLPAGSIAATATQPVRDPTRGQVQTAIKRAERSKSLWATVNICNSNPRRDSIGIRGQMPTLGFAAWLSMDIELNNYSTAKKRFIPDSSTEKLVRLGRLSTGLQQQGALYTFQPGHFLVNASVTFIWRRSGKLLGQTTRTTTALPAHTAFRTHYSAQQCRIH